MNKEISRNMRLGFFVTTGLLLLISALYLIGSKRNIFNSTVKVHVIFHNVNGLMQGDNVRFSGIDVGTVSQIEIISDTVLQVELLIDKKISKFISTDSKASIGTDGLMGNKLVNISPGDGTGKYLTEGATISAIKPIDMDEALRTLSKTNDNLQVITADAKIITQRFSSKNTMWSILLDSNVAKNLKEAVININTTTKNTSAFAENLNSTMTNLKNGKGTLGKLLTDTTLAGNINQSVENFNQSSKNAVTITNDLNTIVASVKKGDGTVGALLTDTTTSHNLNSAINSLYKGAAGFNENMEALKHNFLVRRYFKNKAKAQKKNNTK